MLGGVLLGSVLPDAVDMAIARKNRSLFQRIHRGTTHWPGWYVLLLIGVQLGLPDERGLSRLVEPLFASAGQALAAQSALFGVAAVTGIALGALSHLLLDAFNPTGIPISPFGGKPRLILARIPTGTLGELGFLLLAHLFFVFRIPAVRDWFESLLRVV